MLVVWQPSGEGMPMLRLVVALLLIIHGLIHAAIWLSPARAAPDAPFDAGTSWLVGSQPTLGAALGLLAAVLFVGAGVGLLLNADWWRLIAIVGAVASLVLIGVYFDPWFLFAAAVDVGIIVALAVLDRPGQAILGS
jgi:hypothetical protein